MKTQYGTVTGIMSESEKIMKHHKAPKNELSNTSLKTHSIYYKYIRYILAVFQ